MDKNKENVSKIRFPGFTDPWEQRKLEEEFYKVNERNDGSFGKGHWISVAKMYFQDPEKVTSNNIDTRTYIMRFGDIAFEGNKSKEFKYGRFVVNDIGDGVVSELFPIYRHKQEYDNDFWKRAIQLERMMAPIFAKSITSSGTSSNKLDEKHFLRQFVSVPELSEQKQIGSFFKKLDNLITLHQRKLEHLKDKKKGLLKKMFPKDGEEFPEVRFPGFTDPWEQRKLGELTKVTSAARVHKEEWASSGIPFFRASDVVSAYKGTENKKAFISYELFEQLSRVSGKLGKDDVLMTGGGSIGIPYIVPNNEFLYSKDADLIWIKSSKKFKSQYLYTFFTTSYFRNYVSSISHVGTIAHYTIEQVKDTPIYIPSLAEQEKVGAFFKRLGDLITLHQRKLEHLQQQKKGLLQQMFIR